MSIKESLLISFFFWNSILKYLKIFYQSNCDPRYRDSSFSDMHWFTCYKPFYSKPNWYYTLLHAISKTKYTIHKAFMSKCHENECVMHLQIFIFEYFFIVY